MGNTNLQNLFNELLQNSNSRKFIPAKYNRYTVILNGEYQLMHIP